MGKGYGPDDTCAPMLDGPGCHCRGDSVARRDARAMQDVAALLGRPLAAGQRLVLDPATLAWMRRAFAAGTIRNACAGCDWSGLCHDIANNRFAATVLPVPQPDRLRA